MDVDHIDQGKLHSLLFAPINSLLCVFLFFLLDLFKDIFLGFVCFK
jgi:hypothetical protein